MGRDEPLSQTGLGVLERRYVRRGNSIFGLTLLATLALLLAGLADAASPRASGGLLDLSRIDLEAKGAVYLSGGWEFYWKQLLQPTDFQGPNAPEPTGSITVPGSWNGYRFDDEVLGADGFATYRLRVRLPSQFVRDGGSKAPLALHIPWTYTAYRLWLNGELAAVNGKVGRSRETMIPEFHPRTVHFAPTDQTLELIIQVSNFMHRNGGLWNAPVLGTDLRIEHRQSVREGLEMFLVGGIIVMGIFQFAVYFWFRESAVSLYLGLTSILIALRTLVTGEHFLDQLATGLPWELKLRIEYITGYGFVVAYAAFGRLIFPEDTSKRLLPIAFAVSSIGILTTMVMPVRFSSLFIPYFEVIFGLLILYGVYVYVKAAIHKRESGTLMLVGGLVLSAALIHDLLHYNLMGFDLDLIPTGLFFLLLTQSLTIAQRFAGIFYRQVALTQENADLLETVRLQLHEVKRSREMVAAADENLRQEIAERLHGPVQNSLLAIWHRLGTVKESLKRDPDAALTAVEKARDELDKLRENDIRQVSHTLHPSIVRVGLLPGVRSLARQFSDTFGVTIDADENLPKWDTPDQNRIPESIRLAAYRIIEEALGNARAHAEASAVTISLQIDLPAEESHSGPTLKISVADDGRGFDPGATRKRLGLNAISARVQAVGGRWSIASNPGNGTTLTAELPLPGSPDGPSFPHVS